MSHACGTLEYSLQKIMSLCRVQGRLAAVAPQLGGLAVSVALSTFLLRRAGGSGRGSGGGSNGGGGGGGGDGSSGGGDGSSANQVHLG